VVQVVNTPNILKMGVKRHAVIASAHANGHIDPFLLGDVVHALPVLKAVRGEHNLVNMLQRLRIRAARELLQISMVPVL